MKITKKPKRVNVKYIETKSFISEYKCPTCLIIFKGGGPERNVTRFKCRNCGQELIVN